VILDSFLGPVLVEWYTEAGADAAWAIAVLHRFSEKRLAVDAFWRIAAALHEPERAEKTRCVGNGDAVDVVWAQALSHIAALRCDSVLPELLGMNKIVKRGPPFGAPSGRSTKMTAPVWLRRHLDYCTSPLLAEPWILDIDTL